MYQPCHSSSGRTVPLLVVLASLPERSWSSSLKHVCRGDEIKQGITQEIIPEDIWYSKLQCYNSRHTTQSPHSKISL